ncbi:MULTISPECIES: hypothetical protein [unclassified Spongiibacter]|uniref:hypothetical protein n=1 Tax=Spongiibacter TaxID=630749 RepID=UPI000C0A948A|nr:MULTISPECIES: hypothetical protein [unclassified Spongiibacter]MAK42760.1 hypothetical protein [Spongiibacter sp.]MEE2654042.1 hypothetical protein [Pseudomonadota bacterium]|tara:strand:- start:11563 stop:11862 length:300 start_codon:yes stop_codon:yes gene_type:complete
MSTDRQQVLKIGGLLLGLLLLLGAATAMMLPLVAGFIDQHFTPGLDLRNAAVIAFFVTVATLVVFAFAAGDGLLGELQFMLGGFVSFFLIFWLFIAWIF